MRCEEMCRAEEINTSPHPPANLNRAHSPTAVPNNVGPTPQPLDGSVLCVAIFLFCDKGRLVLLEVAHFSPLEALLLALMEPVRYIAQCPMAPVHLYLLPTSGPFPCKLRGKKSPIHRWNGLAPIANNQVQLGSTPTQETSRPH